MNLIYSHDPMCSWCWAFKPVLAQLRTQLPNGIHFQKLLGGLASDCDEAMPEQTQQMIKNHWRTIQHKVPGTLFNFDFWIQCQPRRSTYPACRAVLAARKQSSSSKDSIKLDDAMTLAIQQAYYLNARNPSDTSTLIALAEEMGLDKKQFEMDLASNEIEELLMNEIRLSRTWGLNSFPSLLLQTPSTHQPITIDYLKADKMLAEITQSI